jgi:hypothetical protein
MDQTGGVEMTTSGMPTIDLTELKVALVATSIREDQPVSHVLADLVSEALLSEDADLCHVGGIEFIKLCEKALNRKCGL